MRTETQNGNTYTLRSTSVSHHRASVRLDVLPMGASVPTQWVVDFTPETVNGQSEHGDVIGRGHPIARVAEILVGVELVK